MGVRKKNLFITQFSLYSIMLKYIPIIIFVLVHITLAITFSLAIHLNHVTYFLPYISDSGTFPPESCIFGQVLNLVAALMSLTLYVRYLQIKEIFSKHNFSHKHQNLNRISFYFGLVACLGCSIVANFQETAMLLVHWLGAILLFGFGAIYQIFQTTIYFQTYPIISNKNLNIFRASLALISSISVLVFIVSGIIAGSSFTGSDVTKWSIEDGGFELHVISTTSEWICACCTMTYLLYFVEDFSKITIIEPEIFIDNNVTVAIN